MGVCSNMRPLTVYGNKTRKEPIRLGETHWNLHISPEEFDAVAAELARTLDYYSVPEREKGEVLAAFAAHKEEVNAGYFDAKR